MSQGFTSLPVVPLLSWQAYEVLFAVGFLIYGWVLTNGFRLCGRRLNVGFCSNVSTTAKFGSIPRQ